MTKPRHRLPFALLLLAIIAVALVPAWALCPIGTGSTIYVGSASDAKCTYHDINTAVANVVCPSTTIVVSDSVVWSAQHIAIANKSFTLTGRAGACGYVAPPICDPDIGCGVSIPARVKLDGTGNGSLSVIAITGTGSIKLSNLEISNGHGAANSTAGGGAVSFNGSGALAMSNLDVHDNMGFAGGVAYYGDGAVSLDGTRIHGNTGSTGGISVESSFIGHIVFTIKENPSETTEIDHNTGTFGGGVGIGGNTHLLAVATSVGRIAIHDNVSSQVGGGLYISGPALADVAIPSNSTSGIYGNNSLFGGGIYVGASNIGSGTLHLFNSLPGAATAVTHNTASAYGGGIEVGGAGAATSSGTFRGIACLFGAGIYENIATKGSGVNVEDGGYLIANPAASSDCDPGAVTALGAVRCETSALACNAISYNLNPGNDSMSSVAAVDFGAGSLVSLNRVNLIGNMGGYVINGASASGATLTLSNCLLDTNQSRLNLIHASGSTTNIDSCTFADDTAGASPNFSFDSAVTFTRSIISEGGVSLLSSPGLVAHDLMINGSKTLVAPDIVYANPLFLNASVHNYRLTAASPAIDFAAAGNEVGGGDYDGQPREADLSGTPNVSGPRDLGAFEYQIGGVADRIFLGIFE